MTKFLTILLLAILVIFLFTNCANQAIVTGGPKDTIPPTLLFQNPKNNEVNYSSKSVTLLFDEWIQPSNIYKELIINPKINGSYKYTTKKDKLTLNFDSSFNKNTTYTLNFRNSIKDITEGNPANNLQIAFSTGSSIDTISLSGQVKNLLTNESINNSSIFLYPFEDTLDLFDGEPLYYTKSDESGRYSLFNIRPGTYKIYAFYDENENQKCEPKVEPYDFLENDIKVIDSNLNSIHFNLLSLDVTPFEIQSHRPNGPYFEIKSNKEIKDYRIESDQKIVSHLINEEKTIRIYNTLEFSENDSLSTNIYLKDTINKEIYKNIYIKFKKSKRKKEPFQFQTNNPTKSIHNDTLQFNIAFSKPITITNSDSIQLLYPKDSTVFYVLRNEDLIWNKNNTKLKILKHLGSINTYNLLYDSATKSLNFKLLLNKGSFISVEADTSSLMEEDFITTFSNNVASASTSQISGKVVTQATNYYIELLNEQFEVVAKQKNKVNFSFKNIAAGQYYLRLLIDEDNNGIWDPGNIHIRKKAEKVYYLDRPISIKENWEIKDLVIGE